jgi:Mrp family chromosome partitioning ATPase/capsular polysaccharide biosynthesis protein
MTRQPRNPGDRTRRRPTADRTRSVYTSWRTPVASSTPSSLPRRDEGAFAPYTRAIRRHPLLVALITLASLAVAFAWVAKRSVQYEATAQILVTPVSSGSTVVTGLPLLSDSVDPTRTLQTAATVLTSPRASLVAAQSLGAGWDAARISHAVKVEPEGDSNIIAVTAKLPARADAIAAANAAARAALSVRADTLRAQADVQLASLRARRDALGTSDPTTSATLAGQIAALEQIREGNDPNFQLQQTASAAKPTGKSAFLILFAGLVVGLLIGTGAALLVEQLDRRVRDEQDVLDRFPLPVMTRVPLTRRRGQVDGRMALLDPLVVEAYRTLQVQIEEPDEQGRVVMLTSASVGDGKTTCAIGLARALGAAGYSVVLLDFDVRKPDVSGRLGVASDSRNLFRPSAHVADLLVDDPDSQLRVLSAPTGSESVNALELLLTRLPDLVAQARDIADYVVIDTAPLGRVSDALRLGGVTDDVLVVVRPGNTDRKELGVARELLEHMAVRPLGLIVIGDTAAGGDGYYGYAQQRASGDGNFRLPALRAAEPSARGQHHGNRAS